MINEMPKIDKEIKFTFEEFRKGLNVIELGSIGKMYAHTLKFYEDGTIAFWGEFYPEKNFRNRHNLPFHFFCDLQIEYRIGVTVKPEDVQFASDALKYDWLWLRILRIYEGNTVRRFSEI